MTIEARKPKDYASAQEVRWCPGCGNYSIIKAVQKVLADADARPEDTVFISGIGCSSRFPYYMETYGFHTIHGRAAAVATGVKLARPELDVWVVSGDGDSLAIGGNHLLHLLRRNADLTYLLLNNEIYGLTKGQASPTSRLGTHTPSSPFGTVDMPVNPAQFALGAGGRFIARAVDTGMPLLVATLNRARDFVGTGFVEVLQNCLVFNDGVFANVEDKTSAKESLLILEHGQPMVFGADRERGLRLDPARLELEVVEIGRNGVTEADILIHDETNRTQAWLLAGCAPPSFPLPAGVLYAAPDRSFMQRQMAIEAAPERVRERLAAAMRSGPTWTI
ncbi:MAG: 2-oxoacid:ferredoxin oxidoreductase subunit beta [Alphaproteobacteria bacterium]